MKKRELITYSTILLASALILGCSTADRTVDELADDGGSIINVPDIYQPDTNSSTDTLPSTGGGTNQDDNHTIIIDAKNAYRVSIDFSDNYNSRGYYSRGELGRLSFDITNLYDGTIANTSIIEKIVLSAEETNENNESKYFKFITYNGEEYSSFSIDPIVASGSVALKMEELSGTTNIIFTTTIKLPESNESSKYEIKIPLVIEKNRSSSMSIVPIDTKYENGLFIDKFVIHVVDSYGNRAEDGTNISTGVINNPKLYSNSFRDDAYNEEDPSILQDVLSEPSLPNSYYHDDNASFDKNSSTITLSSNSIVASDEIVTELDTLVLLANKNQNKPENLGGWDIKSVEDDKLSLISTDTGSVINGVSYAIGNEYRYNECSQTIMNAAASSFNITNIKDGLAFAELRYVPAMVGKSIFIYANSRLENKHIGVSRKITLKGNGIQSQTLSCKYENTGSSCTISYKMALNGISNTVPQNVYLEQPTLAGENVYGSATASKIDCNGWTTIRINDIDENKTATVKFGDFIADELIKNQK